MNTTTEEMMNDLVLRNESAGKRVHALLPVFSRGLEESISDWLKAYSKLQIARYLERHVIDVGASAFVSAEVLEFSSLEMLTITEGKLRENLVNSLQESQLFVIQSVKENGGITLSANLKVLE
jgi:hypothetical protein